MTGAAGIAGVTGAAGIAGVTGAAGIAGVTDAAGIAGVTDAAGIAGADTLGLEGLYFRMIAPIIKAIPKIRKCIGFQVEGGCVGGSGTGIGGFGGEGLVTLDDIELDWMTPSAKAQLSTAQRAFSSASPRSIRRRFAS